MADLEQILLEAQHRWLRPTEICEILRNYQKFLITPDPPVTPPGCHWHLFIYLFVMFLFPCLISLIDEVEGVLKLQDLYCIYISHTLSIV